MTRPLTDEEIAELTRLMAGAWPAPWTAHTFEIDCPCPNGEDCGDLHACEQVEAPEAYPASPEDPAPAGEGQCVVQIAVPGLESLAGPCAAFIAAARNALPSLLSEVAASRAARSRGETADLRQRVIEAVMSECEGPISFRVGFAERIADRLAGRDARATPGTDDDGRKP